MAKEYLDKSGLTYFWNKLKILFNGKQNELVSGTTIKTINGESLLGSGNIVTPNTEYSAGTGIDITNGIISISLTSAEEEEY